MAKDFQPTYKNVHEDIERYLTAIGKRQKTPDGFIVFRGYDDARDLMFKLYLEKCAYEPLVNWLRVWNWENNYNNFLLTLTEELSRRQHWMHLKRLWDGVLAKRRGAYNAVWKIMKKEPDALPPRHLERAKGLLLESLERTKNFAQSFGAAEDVSACAKIIERVEKGKKA